MSKSGQLHRVVLLYRLSATIQPLAAFSAMLKAPARGLVSSRAKRCTEMSTSQGTSPYPSHGEAPHSRRERARLETRGSATGLPPIDPRMPTSTILRDLLLYAPSDAVTLGWLMRQLGPRSFGIILLLLGLLACLPGVSAVAGVLIAIPAYQMIVARTGPVFPRFFASRTFKKQRLAATLAHAVPVLRFLERFIRPRWHTPFETTKRVVGGAILLVGALLFVPIPLSNVPPALTIVLLAFAYLEEDGVLLCATLVTILALLLVAAGIAWQAASLAGWGAGPF